MLAACGDWRDFDNIWIRRYGDVGQWRLSVSVSGGWMAQASGSAPGIGDWRRDRRGETDN